MIKSTEVRKGMVLKIDGSIVRVTEYMHVTPGNLRAVIHIKYKDIHTGASSQLRLGSNDKLEKAFLDNRKMEYLYEDQGGYVFMDLETFEQPVIRREMLEDLMPFIRPNETVDILFHEGEPITIELPSSVIMTVAETEPAVRGDTVQNVVKPATTDTGLQIKVPNHIKEGDKVKINTSSGEFQERVND